MVNLALTYPTLYKDQMRLSTTGFKEVFAELLLALKDIQRQTERLGGKMLLLVLPNNVQVSQRYHQYYSQLGMVMEPGIAKDRFLQEELQRFSAANDISFIDPLPYIKENPQLDFFQDDGHLTSSGHAHIAHFVAKFFRRHQLIPKARMKASKP